MSASERLLPGSRPPAEADEGEIALRGWTFVQIPIALVRDTRVSANAFRLFCAIATYANADKKAWPGQSRLAADLGVTERAIRAWLEELTESGWLTITRRGRQKTNVYTLHALPDRKPSAEGERNGDSAHSQGDRHGRAGQAQGERSSDSGHARGGHSERNGHAGQAEVTGSPIPVTTGTGVPANDIQQNQNQKLPNDNAAATARSPSAEGRRAAGNSDNLTTILQVYEGEIGPLSPMVRASLADLANEFTAAQFEAAVHEAVANNVRRLKYVEAILRRWQLEGDDPTTQGGDETESPPPPARQNGAPAVRAAPVVRARLCDLLDTAVTLSAAEVWQATLSQMQLQASRPTFDTWLRGSEVIDLGWDASEQVCMVVRVRNDQAKAWLEGRLLPSLVRTASSIAGTPVQVQFVGEMQAGSSSGAPG